MKYLSVKKLERMYYQISYSFATNSYNRNFLIMKKAIITFFGLPLYSTKTIMVQPHPNDLRDLV